MDGAFHDGVTTNVTRIISFFFSLSSRVINEFLKLWQATTLNCFTEQSRTRTLSRKRPALVTAILSNLPGDRLREIRL